MPQLLLASGTDTPHVMGAGAVPAPPCVPVTGPVVSPQAVRCKA